MTMRRIKRIGRDALYLLLNLLFNLEWSIPAWVLLGLHHRFDISIGWFIGGLMLWVLRGLAGMWFVGWASKCGNQKDPPKENKNPYSVKGKDGGQT